MNTKRTRGNFKNYDGGFPLDCETLAMLQEQMELLELLGGLLGDKVILSGCGVNGERRAGGYVLLRTGGALPKVMYWQGGPSGEKNMHVEQAVETVESNGARFEAAYVSSWLAPGTGSGSAATYSWDDFQSVDTLKEISERMRSLKSEIASNGSVEPIGTLKAWALNGAPEGGTWLLCDGETYDAADYPELYNKLHSAFHGTKDKVGSGGLITHVNVVETPAMCTGIDGVRYYIKAKL